MNICINALMVARSYKSRSLLHVKYLRRTLDQINIISARRTMIIYTYRIGTVNVYTVFVYSIENFIYVSSSGGSEKANVCIALKKSKQICRLGEPGKDYMHYLVSK